MEKKWDVLGFGAIAVDDLFYVDHYPSLDEKIPITRKQRQGGGNTATALVAVSRLGSKAAYCGVLGDDELSLFSIHELEQEGVDTSAIIRKNGARPFAAVVIVDMTHGKRSILFSNEGVVQPGPADVSESLVAQCKVLFVDHQAVDIGLHAACLAKKNAIPVVGDFEGALHSGLLELVDLVDHLIVGIDFGRKLTDKTDVIDVIQALARPDRACCVITDGERGCWYSECGGEVRHVPAMKVQVVDTTGCGDVFHGAYASAISQGQAIPQAIQSATVAAGLKATQAGGRAGIPNYQSVVAYMEQR